MFDEIRQEAEESNFDEPEVDARSAYMSELTSKPQYFLGMTPVQRFILSVELLFTVCLIGTLVLLVLERVYPPFLF
jgi:hypothetical protein